MLVLIKVLKLKRIKGKKYFPMKEINAKGGVKFKKKENQCTVQKETKVV